MSAIVCLQVVLVGLSLATIAMAVQGIAGLVIVSTALAINIAALIAPPQ